MNLLYHLTPLYDITFFAQELTSTVDLRMEWIVGGDVSVDMPYEWAESLNHDMALMRENPEFMIKYTFSQIIHQISSTPNAITRKC